jgi:hypothetical protein
LRSEQGRYHAGDDIRDIWGEYLNEKRKFHKKPASWVLNPRGSELINESIRYETPGDFFNEFIRIYWNFPHGN